MTGEERQKLLNEYAASSRSYFPTLLSGSAISVPAKRSYMPLGTPAQPIGHVKGRASGWISTWLSSARDVVISRAMPPDARPYIVTARSLTPPKPDPKLEGKRIGSTEHDVGATACEITRVQCTGLGDQMSRRP